MTASPDAGLLEAFQLDAHAWRARWPKLHGADRVPYPDDGRALSAWVLYHSGEFQRAEHIGIVAGVAGLAAAHRAGISAATVVERSERVRLQRLQNIYLRALAHAAQAPEDASAWYGQGDALVRYSQGIGMARALAKGLGERLRGALLRTLELEPQHAAAHVALGVYLAEVVAKVGPLIASMTYGATPELAWEHLRRGLQLAPDCPWVLLESAHALRLIEGDAAQSDSLRLYERAAACTPLDATQQLCVALAQAELRD